MINIMQTAIIAGVVGSILTEAFKLIPALRYNTITQAITAIVVTTAVSFVTEGKFTLEGVVAALIVALTTYKTVVEPVAITAGLSSQK